jgi:hypothetical protein
VSGDRLLDNHAVVVKALWDTSAVDHAPDDDIARIIDLHRTYDGEKMHEPEVWLRKTSQSSIRVHVTFVATGISVKLTGWNAPADKGDFRPGWPEGQMTLQHGEAVQLRNLLSQQTWVRFRSKRATL